MPRKAERTRPKGKTFKVKVKGRRDKLTVKAGDEATARRKIAMGLKARREVLHEDDVEFTSVVEEGGDTK